MPNPAKAEFGAKHGGGGPAAQSNYKPTAAKAMTGPPPPPLNSVFAEFSIHWRPSRASPTWVAVPLPVPAIKCTHLCKRLRAADMAVDRGGESAAACSAVKATASRRRERVRGDLDRLRSLPQRAARDRRRIAREQAPASPHTPDPIRSWGSLEAIPSEPPSLARQKLASDGGGEGMAAHPLGEPEPPTGRRKGAPAARSLPPELRESDRLRGGGIPRLVPTPPSALQAWFSPGG